jgi:DNA-binding PadR family transcriptional regulator
MVRKKEIGGEEILILNELELKLVAIANRRMSTGREILNIYNREVNAELPKGTLYPTMKKMKDHGIIVLDLSARDFRSRIFWVTKYGKKVLRESRKYYSDLAGYGLE